MDRLSSRLLEKLKLTDSGSVKLSSKKKGEPVNANNNNSSCGGEGAGQAPGEVSGCACRGLAVTPAPRDPAHDPADPPLHRSVPGRPLEAGSLGHAVGVGLASHRRYSLELQHLAYRRQLLSQPAPPPYAGPFPAERERHKRLSLQEALLYPRGVGEPWDRAGPAPGPAPSPAPSPRSSLSLQESPRSSFASTASGGGGSPLGSRCSSSHTSGISLGFDSRHAPAPALALARPLGAPAAHMWRDYLDGAGGAGQDSRHSYPPALGSAAWGEGPAWGEGLQAGGRGRYSDLPGKRYQEELTQLLRWEAAQRGHGMLGNLEGLTLKDPPPGPSPAPCPASCPAPAQPKPPAEQGGARDPDSRQDYFGEIIIVPVNSSDYNSSDYRGKQ